MEKKLFILILFLTQSCFYFKENPLDPTTPTGMLLNLLLNPLPKQLKIFVTAYAGNGNIAGWSYPGSNAIEKADNACNSDSNKPDSNSYKAMIVDGAIRQACSTNPYCTDPTENVDWVFKPNTDYYRVDGTYLFTTNSAGILTTGTNINQITSSSVSYWTGLGSDWKHSPTNCNIWTNSLSFSGVLGSGTATDYKWYSDTSSICNNSAKLLCVEQ